MDVRVIASTNRDLWAAVQEGTFREDLYYRLRVVPIAMPALRDRRQDVPLLIDHMVRRFAARTGRPIEGVSPQALRALYDYDYPGNVRELENIIERAFVLCRSSEIDVGHLPAEVTSELASQAEASLLPRPVAGQLRPSEEAIVRAQVGGRRGSGLPSPARKLVEVLDAHGWNRTETARALGIGRNTLWRRMKEYGLLERSSK